MRNALSALEAFSRDACAISAPERDAHASLGGWLAVTKAAERLSVLPVAHRAAYLQSLTALVLPPSESRPTLVRDGDLPPKDPTARLAERFRIEAEDMERSGCFEMAFATVAAICRLVAHADLVTRTLATAHLGRIARQLGDYSTAQDCYSCVVTEAARERDQPLEAMGLLGLGALARMKGNRPEERRLYDEALTRASPGGITERSARQGLMNVAIAEDRLADALLHGWRVYDLAEEGGEVQAMILSNLALTALKAGFVSPALQGFLHVLSMTGVLRIRMLTFGNALRAAAQLGDRARMNELEFVALDEADRANVPFEVASFFLSATEAWCALPDIAVALRRLARLESLVAEHQFHELAIRAESLRAQFTTAARSAKATARSPWNAPSETVWDEQVTVGIHRLACLRS